MLLNIGKERNQHSLFSSIIIVCSVYTVQNDAYCYLQVLIVFRSRVARIAEVSEYLLDKENIPNILFNVNNSEDDYDDDDDGGNRYTFACVIII